MIFIDDRKFYTLFSERFKDYVKMLQMAALCSSCYEPYFRVIHFIKL